MQTKHCNTKQSFCSWEKSDALASHWQMRKWKAGVFLQNCAKGASWRQSHQGSCKIKMQRKVKSSRRRSWKGHRKMPHRRTKLSLGQREAYRQAWNQRAEHAKWKEAVETKSWRAKDRKELRQYAWAFLYTHIWS